MRPRAAPVLRDLFADEYENGVWLEDPKLLNELATAKAHRRRRRARDPLEVGRKPCWKRTGARPRATGASIPQPSEETDAESAEIERLRTRHDEIATMEEHEWTDELVEEAEAIEARLHAIGDAIDARATFRPEDFAMAGCIATIGRDGTLEVIEGLVKPEDMPKEPAGDAHANGPEADAGAGATTDPGSRVDAPAMTTPIASPPDPRAKARADAGVGIGLADDSARDPHRAREGASRGGLRGRVRPRGVPDGAYRVRARATPRRGTRSTSPSTRPPSGPRRGRTTMASPRGARARRCSPTGPTCPSSGWRARTTRPASQPLQALPRVDKERLFAAAVARTVKGQLAFEHDARDLSSRPRSRGSASTSRSTCAPRRRCFWSRINKSRILDVARETFGAAWAAARSKLRKPDLAKAMEEAFAAGPPPVGFERHGARHRARLDDAGVRGIRCGRLARRARRRHGARGRHSARRAKPRTRRGMRRTSPHPRTGRALRRWSRASSPRPWPSGAPPPSAAATAPPAATARAAPVAPGARVPVRRPASGVPAGEQRPRRAGRTPEGAVGTR